MTGCYRSVISLLFNKSVCSLIESTQLSPLNTHLQCISDMQSSTGVHATSVTTVPSVHVLLSAMCLDRTITNMNWLTAAWHSVLPAEEATAVKHVPKVNA